MQTTTAMRSSDSQESFTIASCLEDTVCPPTTAADPDISSQKTARSSSQSDDQLQSGSAQVRSTPGTALNASEKESQDVEHIGTDAVIDVGDTDFVIFDENCEHLARAGKKRRFDDFLGTEIKSLTKTIELGYRHATQPSKVQDTKRMTTRLQKRRLEEARDTWVEKAPLRDGENYDTFQTPQAEGRLSDFALTKELGLALARIEEAEKLLDDASSSIEDKLVQSRGIISYVIRCIDYSSL